MTTQWHPITEIPPIDAGCLSCNVLLIGASNPTIPADVVCFTGWYNYILKRWRWYGDHGYGDFVPTHWCDLPTPSEISNESS